jgi:hypothetical protein
MRRTLLILLVVGLVLTVDLACPHRAPSAWAISHGPYDLAPQSNYQEGCFEPCMCPIMMNETLAGTFQLEPVAMGADHCLFEVLDVAWRFEMGPDTLFVTGAGSYVLEAGQQRMVLDLRIGDGPVQTFDSGLVPVQAEFPDIAVAVAVNGFFCYDYVFDILAKPAPVTLHVSSWGELKALYR